MNSIEKELIVATIEEFAGDNKDKIMKFIGDFLDGDSVGKNYIIIDKDKDKLTLHYANKETTVIKIDADTVKTKDMSFALDIYNSLKES